jgi:cysteine-rich repeat protein
MRSARLVLASTCLALIQCVEVDPSSSSSIPTSAKAPPLAEPIKTERGTLVEMARIEGHGNPETGELWMRVVPTGADGQAREDGVEGNAQALARPGGNCSLTANDPDEMRGTNPDDTLEFYTLGNVAGAPTNHQSSFDPGVCETHLESDLAADPFYSSVLFPSSGTGCAYQRVQNFYSKRFERVFMDIDVWNGNYTTNGPYGPGFTNGTTTTRPGRNAPSQSLGLWDFGPLAERGAPGDTVDMWIFFKNAPGGGDFNFSGLLIGELIETCGDNDDDDCDGVNDNNCGNTLTGDACFSDLDCAEGLACRGASIVSRQGTANGGTDSPGTCMRGPFGGTKLAGGAEHNCAVLPAGAANAGEVKCWGAATSQGTGNPVDVTSAAAALPLELGGSPAVSVAAGFAHSCAVFEDGTVRCWGGNWDRQARGSDGAAVMATATAPLPLDVGAPARQVVAGGGHTCVLRDDGGVRCFGANYNGECGARSGSDQLSLRGTQDVALGGQAAQLCAGEEHTCALLDDGSVRCWGSGANGRLGYGNTVTIGDDEEPGSISPVQILTAAEISAGRTVRSIGCGGKQTCAILDDGGLRCWGAGVALGYDTSGNLDKGDDELPSSLPLVNVGSPVRQVSIGQTSTCALLVGGEVKCWGSTAAPNGCLGYPAGCPANLWQPPVANVNLGSGLTAVELSTRSTGASVCALLSNGTVKCWGANTHYQGGYGDTSAAISPPRSGDTLPAPSNTVLDACTDDSDCSPTTLCHAGMCVSRGPLRVTLTWTSESDLDLFVTTPSAGTINASNQSLGGGTLDDDEFAPNWNLIGGNHVENIAFPGSPPAGHYTFWAVNGSISSSYTLEAFYDGVLIAQDKGTLAASAQTPHFEIQYPVICGDGHVTLGEDCDAASGCSDACTVQPGFTCTGGVGEHSVCSCAPGMQDYDMNDTCSPLGCGDGGIDGDEACDDGDTSSGDGCSDSCTIESGWECLGEPSLCTTDCGDGVITVGLEECDDGLAFGGDGCSENCVIEFGYSCTGTPSDCTTTCGDGLVAGAEECDDDAESGDGCTGCAIDHGYYCTSSPSLCNTVCGDGLLASTEACDDNGTTGGNGCSPTCALESGFACTGEPSTCGPVCGDGLIVGGEGCDDQGTTSGNGCSSTCAVESGYSCMGAPSACAPVCGDGLVRAPETCDDQGTTSGNGCSSGCQIETGYTCNGLPSVCTATCGDGVIVGSEGCDDMGTTSGNGCSATCTVESGYNCTGQPSVCNTICGDGLVRGSEQCDELNSVNGDGCDVNCTNSACGNTITAPNEECDDGNTMGGDSCPSDCTFNECIGEGGGNNCDAYASCTDTNPSFTCACNQGFLGNGTTNNCVIGNRVFTSSGTYSGNLGGHSGADDTCESLASGAGFGGSWRAWLSSPGGTVRTSFIGSQAPYRLMNGVQIASSWNDLLDGSALAAPINVTQTGSTIGGQFDVWTGTEDNGTMSGLDCIEWTSSSSAQFGSFGFGDVASVGWSNGFQDTCDLLKRVHCFEQFDHVARVFVSSTLQAGNLGGAAGADALCQTLANNEALGGRWKAWISDAGTTPFARFAASPVTYKTLDGFAVAAYWSALGYLDLINPINVDEQGVLLGGTFDVWTGTNRNGSGTGTNCSGWTSSSSGVQGTYGFGEQTVATWSAGSTGACNVPQHVYCFEQLPGSPAPAPPLRAFVTSTTYPATFGSVLWADAECQSVAAGAGMTGSTWRAWVSSGGAAVSDRFTRFNNPVIAVNGPLLANDYSDLTAYNTLWSPLDRNPSGGVISPQVFPWTGTLENGKVDTGFTCTDWTSTSGSGGTGDTGGADLWSSEYSAMCNTTRPFYCFEQSAGTPPPKRAFVTSTNYTGSIGGIAGADTQCQMRANAASLGGTWRAWLGASGQSPGRNFRSHGPYRRLDGVTIANDWKDLTDGTLAATLDVTELNMPRTTDVWTSVTFSGAALSPNCNNWTSTGSTATYGSTTIAGNGWTNMTTAGCSTPKALYCFEQ